MRRNGFISAVEADAARGEPLVVHDTSASDLTSVDYFAEEVRRDLLRRFGETALYEGGTSVRTSIQPRLQAIADRPVRQGLVALLRRQGCSAEAPTHDRDD